MALLKTIVLLLLVCCVAESQFLGGSGRFGSTAVANHDKLSGVATIPNHDDTVTVTHASVPLRRGELTMSPSSVDTGTGTAAKCNYFSFNRISDTQFIAWRVGNTTCGEINLRWNITVDSSFYMQNGIATISTGTKAIAVTLGTSVARLRSIEKVNGASYNGDARIMGFMETDSRLVLSSYGNLSAGDCQVGWQVRTDSNITVRLRDTTTSTSTDLRVYVAGITDSTNVYVSSSSKINATSGQYISGNIYLHKIDSLRLHRVASIAGTRAYVVAQIAGTKFYRVPMAFGTGNSATGTISTPVNQNVSTVYPSGLYGWGGYNNVSVAVPGYFMANFYFGSTTTVLGDRYDNGGYTFSPIIQVGEWGN